MKECQRKLLEEIFRKLYAKQPHDAGGEKTKTEVETASLLPKSFDDLLKEVGSKSGNPLFGHSHGKGISGEDVEKEAAVAVGVTLDRVAASNIAHHLNKNKSINGGVNELADKILADVTLLSPKLIVTAGDSTGDVLVDLIRKHKPLPQSKAWLFVALFFCLLTVSPMFMFSYLEGPKIRGCIDKDGDNHCSKETTEFWSWFWGIVPGGAFTLCTAMFTLFTLGLLPDRDATKWISDSVRRSPLQRFGSWARYWLFELPFGGGFGSTGMMTFLTSTLILVTQLIEGHGEINNDIDYKDPRLVISNYMLLLIGSLACVYGNANNLHNFIQRFFHRDWRNFLHQMKSFNQNTREKVSLEVEKILSKTGMSPQEQSRKVVQYILSLPKGQVMSDRAYYISQAVAVPFLGMSAFDQYYGPGKVVPLFFGSMFQFEVPPALGVLKKEASSSFGFVLSGLSLFTDNWIFMINAFCALLSDRFLEGKKDKNTRGACFRLLSIPLYLLALIGSGAAFAQGLMTADSSYGAGLLLTLAFATAFQALLFNLVGVDYSLSKLLPAHKDSSADAKRSSSLNASLLEAQPVSSSSRRAPTFFFDQTVNAVLKFTESNCPPTFPLSKDEVSSISAPLKLSVNDGSTTIFVDVEKGEGGSFQSGSPL